MSLANFLSGRFIYRTQKTEQDNASLVAAPTTLNASTLSAVLEVWRVVHR